MIGILVTTVLWPSPGNSAVPTPPGGPNATYRGGDNLAPYPPITTNAVPDPSAIARLGVIVQPNPTRGETRFRAQVRRGERIRARLYSVSGRLVREWAPEAADAGWVEWRWDGRDRTGSKAATGLYFFRVEAGGRRAIGRVALIR